MVFRIHSSQLSEATKSIAGWIFTAGLLLLGFGVLIIALPAVFIFIAAGIFFLAGLSVIGYAARLFIAAGRMGKDLNDNSRNAYRENVKIHGNHDDQGDVL